MKMQNLNNVNCETTHTSITKKGNLKDVINELEANCKGKNRGDFFTGRIILRLVANLEPTPIRLVILLQTPRIFYYSEEALV
jgi:hypothetical protein